MMLGRIADQGGRTADIGNDGLADYIQLRVQAHAGGQLDDDGNDDQHCGHIVQKGGQYGGDNGKEDQNLERAALGHLGDADRNDGEESGFAQNRHDGHHAQQQHDGFEIDELHGLVFADHVQGDQHHHTHQRGHGLVDQLEGQRHINEQKNNDRYQGFVHVQSFFVGAVSGCRKNIRFENNHR